MTKPFVYVSLSQTPGVYEFSFVLEDMTVTYHGSLMEFEMLADSIRENIAEQRVRDAEHRGSER